MKKNSIIFIISIFMILVFHTTVPTSAGYVPEVDHKTINHCTTLKNGFGMNAVTFCNSTFWEYEGTISYVDVDATVSTIPGFWVDGINTYNRYISSTQRETKASGTAKSGIHTQWFDLVGSSRSVIRRMYIYGNGNYTKIW